MNFCAPRHRALLEHAVERVFERFDELDEPELRVMAANFVGFHCHYTGAWRRIQPLLQKVRACGDLERAPPDLVITWYLHEAGRAGQAGQHAAAMRHIASARQHADASGVHVLDMLVSAHAVYSELNAGELGGAHAHATDMRRMVDPRRAIDVAHCDYMDAAIALARGDAGRAVRLTTHGVAVGEQCSADSVAAQFRALRGMALVEVGKFDDALVEAQHVLAYATASGHGIFAHPALMLAAYAQLRSGDHQAAGKSLAQALALGQAREQVVVFPFMPLHMLQALYGHALREDIHAEFVRGVINVRQLRAPEDADRHWPWRVRIHTLGHFELRVDGERLRATGKQPRKPIELLKAIVGFGGQDVRMERLIRALWPEFAEGDRSGDEVKAFEVTLHRLRKLLRADDAVTVGNRLVSLNPQRVWTDVREFEQASGPHNVTHSQPDALADVRAERDHLEAEVRCLLETYRGPFLPEAPDAAWTVTMRQRLGTMFRDGVLRLGARLESVDDRARARWLYEEAIARAPLSERLYRHLMRCLLADGERAEAIAVYQRCRSVLSALLGARPSRETEALHRRALDPAQG